MADADGLLFDYLPLASGSHGGTEVLVIATQVSPVEPDPGVGSPPEIQNVSPNLDSSILPTATVQFDIVDTDGDLFDVVVFAIFAENGIDEVVHFGSSATAFGQRYLQSSTRTAITNGFRYSIKRVGGWPEPPRLRIRAFDEKLNAVQ